MPDAFADAQNVHWSYLLNLTANDVYGAQRTPDVAHVAWMIVSVRKLALKFSVYDCSRFWSDQEVASVTTNPGSQFLVQIRHL